MPEAPKDRSGDDARVIDLDAERRRRRGDDMTAPGPSHPASRAMEKSEPTESEKDEEFGRKFNLDND